MGELALPEWQDVLAASSLPPSPQLRQTAGQRACDSFMASGHSWELCLRGFLVIWLLSARPLGGGHGAQIPCSPHRKDPHELLASPELVPENFEQGGATPSPPPSPSPRCWPGLGRVAHCWGGGRAELVAQRKDVS